RCRCWPNCWARSPRRARRVGCAGRCARRWCRYSSARCAVRTRSVRPWSPAASTIRATRTTTGAATGNAPPPPIPRRTGTGRAGEHGPGHAPGRSVPLPPAPPTRRGRARSSSIVPGLGPRACPQRGLLRLALGDLALHLGADLLQAAVAGHLHRGLLHLGHAALHRALRQVRPAQSGGVAALDVVAPLIERRGVAGGGELGHRVQRVGHLLLHLGLLELAEQLAALGDLLLQTGGVLLDGLARLTGGLQRLVVQALQVV